MQVYMLHKKKKVNTGQSHNPEKAIPMCQNHHRVAHHPLPLLVKGDDGVCCPRPAWDRVPSLMHGSLKASVGNISYSA